MSDIPSGREPSDWRPGEEEQQNKEKPMLQSAGETVASALGGTSRGGLAVLFGPAFPFSSVEWLGLLWSGMCSC